MNLFSPYVRILLSAAIAVIGVQAAWAQTWDCGKTPGTVTATVKDGTLTISGTGAMKDYNDISAPWSEDEINEAIRNVVIMEGVTSIGDNAFSMSHMDSIAISEGVVSIGEGAFLMTWLNSITIPNSVTSIGARAFVYSALESITIGSGVISIGDRAFRKCIGLKSITIPNGVTSIGDGAFEDCGGLRRVTIGGAAASIGDNAFFGCDRIRAILSLNASPPVLGGFLPDGKGICVYVPESGIEAYRGTEGWKDFSCFVSLDNVELEAEVWDCGVTPGSVTASLNEAGTFTLRGTGAMRDHFSSGEFRGAIAEAVISDGVTSIGSDAFEGCINLKSITIPNSVASIGSSAFEGCINLTSITIPNSVASIGEKSFNGCAGLTSITIPSSVTHIGGGAFSNCTGLTAIEIADGNADYSSEDGVLFNKDGTALIQYPAGKHGDSYSIPESVASIESYAFSACAALTAVTTLNATPLAIHDHTFHSLSRTARLYVPDGSVDAYDTADGWRYFAYINDEYVGVSVTAHDRVIPAAVPNNETAVIAPLNKLTAEFTVGPNPASKSSGAVNFFRTGSRVKSASLSVYDAYGNAVKKIIIRDDAVVGGKNKRAVGSWNLTDAKGRPVPAGTYLVRGTVAASNGKSEKVSAVVGVR